MSLIISVGEKWWGGAVNDGIKMPFEDGYSYNMYGSLRGNQAQPLLISNFGRVIWSEKPFSFEFSGNELILKAYGDLKIHESQTSLKEAYEFASLNYFPSDGKIPDTLLFSQPQYNTWIELIYDQNQKDILAYAHAIIDNGFPPGVLMIDDNWQVDYGVWQFKSNRFPDPKSMIRELHNLGFKVMMWVCPFISPDSDVFRALAKENLFLKVPDDYVFPGGPLGYAEDVAIVGWWNGFSALLDFSNPEAVDWFKLQLDVLMEEYGVDGFKLDAGDAIYYPDWLQAHQSDLTPNEHSEFFAQIGLDYPLNEYRATWKMGGKALAQRLRDKGHNWPALRTLIPNTTLQGLMGYPYTCPDMIGGGEFTSFLDPDILDQELIVRSAQVHALMPMMQFSVAPWRVLDSDHLAAVKLAVETRKLFTKEIMKLAHNASINNEPIVRSMEYEFPKSGFEEIKDQFMLGSEILVAPVLVKGQKERVVKLPKGQWLGFDGRTYSGNLELNMKVDLLTIPYFRKVKDH